jgi:hypothetical protein
MSAGTPLRIILAAEGTSDILRIRALIDHLLQKHVNGTARLDDLRQFEGLDREEYIQIKKIPELARARGFSRRYAKGDGDTLRKLYQVLQKEKLLSQQTVILWARDDDGHHERRHDAEAARKALPSSPPLLLAIASECGEAWIIAGFAPTTSDDKAKLEKLRQALGFWPHKQPECLSHKENVPKSAKTVLRHLFEGDKEREENALISAAKSDDQASIACGLRAFREEVVAWLGDTHS